jgi:hypothetical protein
MSTRHSLLFHTIPAIIYIEVKLKSFHVSQLDLQFGYIDDLPKDVFEVNSSLILRSFLFSTVPRQTVLDIRAAAE